jgi:hypothetical protein
MARNGMAERGLARGGKAGLAMQAFNQQQRRLKKWKQN